VQPLDVRPTMPLDLREAFEASWRDNEAIYRALGES
jgi:hypothetical protein